MFVDFHILNELGSPSINSNTFANRPSAGQVGRLFVSTDTYEIYRDNGTTWDLIGGPGSSTVTGTGTATQVAYWTASQAIGGSNNLWWDNTNGFLGVNTNTPTAATEVVKTDGVGIYSNFTTNVGTSTANGLLVKNTTNSSGYAAVFDEVTPNSSAGQYPVLIRHSLSSGTAAANMATGIHFSLPDDAGTARINQFSVDTVDAAAATYSNRYRFLLRYNGSAVTPFYITGTGLGVFTATPGAALDVHSTGIIAQLNSTGTTNNGYLAFQRNGSGIWRIGDSYNGGNNFFELHNTVLTIDAMEFQASTNKSTFQAQETYTTGLARGNYFDYNLSVSDGGSFSTPNSISAIAGTLDLTLAGNATIPSGARSGWDAYNTISFTGSGTLTHNQGTQIRAYSNLTTGWAFAGSATGTITHLAGLRVLFPDNSGSAVTITNNYGLLINDQTANTGTVTYTNRWGVYQEGTSDLNYMAANLLLGSTVNNGNKLQVTGNGNLTGDMTADAYYLNGMTAGNGALYWTSDRVTLANYNNNGVLHFEVNNGAFAAMFDASGNLGLGVIPSAHAAGGSFQIGSGKNISFSGQEGYIAANQYYNGSSSIYIANGNATQYAQEVGAHKWLTAPSGTAGNPITFTQAMTLAANGNFGLGTSSPTFFSGFLTSEINNTGGNAIQLITGTNVIAQIISSYSSGLVYMGSRSNSDLTITTNDTRVATFKTNGNFLIGTTTDGGQLLQVNGVAYFGSNVLFGNTVTNPASGFANQKGFGYNNTTGVVEISANNATTLQIGRYNGTGDLIQFRYASNSVGKITSDGNVDVNGTIKTGAPNTGTAAAWKLGSRVAATVVVNTTEYIEIDIGGTLYKLATVT